jgi:hypothetical protein
MSQILIIILVFLTKSAFSQTLDQESNLDKELNSHFACKVVETGKFKPFYLKVNQDGSDYTDYSKTPKGLLGQNPMTTAAECAQALESANHEFGVICSRTGLNGWKPTIYTGTRPGRADFGYLGGTSMMRFSDCLDATSNSSVKGVCFWGGSDWYVSPIDREGVSSGPYQSLEKCVAMTKQ